MDLLDWYLTGVAAGLGVAAAIPLARTGERRIPVLAAVLGLGLAIGIASVLATDWTLAAAAVGIALGLVFLRRLSREAVLVAVLALAAIALVPMLGYLEAAATPFLARRLRQRADSRYAGLRILAKD